MAQGSPRFDSKGGGKANKSAKLVVSTDATFSSAEAVSLNLVFGNLSEAPVLLGYPGHCLPAGVAPGVKMARTDWHNKAEILLKVTGPSGQSTILRANGAYRFQPSGVFCFSVEPGAEARFSLGRFFQTPEHAWEDQEQARRLFVAPGEYKARVLYRNTYPELPCYDEVTGKAKLENAWIGELYSNEVAFLRK